MKKKIISGKIAIKDFEIIEGYLVIENGIISDINRGKPPKDPYINGLVLPSFINAHTHLGDFFLDVNLENYSLAELVGPGGIKHQGLKKMSDEEKIEGMRRALNYGYSKGVTGFCDFREGGIKGAKLLKKANKDQNIGIKTYGRPKEVKKEELDKLAQYIDGLGLSSVNDYSNNELSLFKSYIKEKDLKVALHAAETLIGQKKSLKETNRTEISRALEFDPNHLIHVTNPIRNDLELIEKSKTAVVLCPRTNRKTDVGDPPIKEVLERDILVGLGTDNAMINSPSLIDELRFLVKNYFEDTEEINEEKLKTFFKIATLDNAEIIGVNNRIKKGQRPNLVIFEKTKNPLKSIIDGENKIKEIIN